MCSSMRFPTFNAMIFKIVLVFMITAYLNAINNSADELYKRKVFLTMFTYTDQVLTPERGYIATRDLTIDELMSNDITVLGQRLEGLHKEVECSFVFSALVHMYLTNIYLSEPEYIGRLTTEQANSLTFTEEAAYIVNYAFEKQKSNLVEVMWILYLYALRTAEFINSYTNGDDGFDNKIILAAHNTVEKVLEEFTESYQCKVYNQETGQPQEIKYADKIKEVMQGRTTGIPLTITYNKERFLNQRNSNKIPVGGMKRFGLKQLRLCHLLEDRHTIDELIDTFSVHVDSNPIVDRLSKLYQQTYNVNVSLHEYINSLITLQSEFITVLKAIAMRIVMVYLSYMKTNLKPSTQDQRVSFLYDFCEEDKSKMVAFLTDFATYIDQATDIHLKRITSLLNECSCKFFLLPLIDRRASIVLSLLKSISSDKGDLAAFANPLLEKDYGDTWMVGVKEIAKKYFIIYSEDIKDSVDKIIIVTDIFFNYVKKITEGFDFGIINSLIRLKESENYKRLVERETEAD